LLAFELGTSITIAFFVGAMFALSHGFRSLLTVLSSGLGLYFLLAVFWNTLVQAITSPYTGMGGAEPLTLASWFYNPIQYTNLVWAALTNAVPQGYGGLYGAASSYGAELWSVGLAAAAWALIPAVLLVTLVCTRD
jgi:hypothetical protein